MIDIAPLGYERFPIWENPIPVPRGDHAAPAPASRTAEPIEASTGGPAVGTRASGDRAGKHEAAPETGAGPGARPSAPGGMEALYLISAELGRVLLELQETNPIPVQPSLPSAIGGYHVE